MKKNIEILEKTPLFSGLNQNEILTVLNKFEAYSKHYSKNEYIKTTGDKADFIGIVLKGNVQILQDDYFGNRSIIAGCEAGDIFAEAFACGGVEELPVDILSCDQTEIMFIPKNSIFKNCDSSCPYHNHIMNNLLMIVSKKSMMLNKKLKYISHKTTREKLMAYLSDQAKMQHSASFTIPFDRQGLADYLGVERSAMSAEISKLVNEGYIETKRSNFKIL